MPTDKPECSITLREMEGKTRLICEVKANPKMVEFTWMLNNTTLSKDIVHIGLQSILTVDGPPPATGIFYCYVNNSVGISTPCEINVEGIKSFYSYFRVKFVYPQFSKTIVIIIPTSIAIVFKPHVIKMCLLPYPLLL